MATMSIQQNSKTFTISKWLGINESTSGDANAKMGESVVMRNFRITPESYLQIRPGYSEVVSLAEGHPVRALHRDVVGGTERVIAVCNGKAYSLNTSTYAATEIGTLADAPTTIFGFSNKLYFLNGTEYKVWNGTTFADVAGYVPLTYTGCVPSTGGGTAAQRVNKLTGSKEMWFSADGTAAYKLTESDITSVDSVIVSGVLKTVTTHYTVNLTTGTVTFTSGNIPAAADNNVKIKYTKGTGSGRADILAQKFIEFYNGNQDARVFLYGDSTNKCYYSDLEYSGAPSAEYFPDLNEISVDTSNTPITALIRHYDRLLIYKSDDAFVGSYDIITLNDGTVTAGFKISPLNRAIGNEAMGQVQLVSNNPFSLYESSVYEWVTSSTRDERNAQRISDRVRETLKSFDLSACLTFDDQDNFEYWIVHGTTAVVFSYAANAWFIYTNIPASCFERFNGSLFFGTSDGGIMRMSTDYHSDNGEDIDALYESGSMAFGNYTYRKFLPYFHSALVPEVGSRITVTLQTDRKSDFDEKVIANNVLNFTHIDFAHWSFKTNRKPQTRRTKLKAKKFVYLKLILSSKSSSATATVLSVSFPITYTNQVK